ncbi:hypothetical protein [Antarctobacter jejuensis]|uniref:hypothetical protein n=1 Tax=Antarctobacter jejuensis TaxID=1439938 RepID=UPI003FD5479A
MIGHSHVEALRLAEQEAPSGRLTIHNLSHLGRRGLVIGRRVPRLLRAIALGLRPHAVCLCLMGNQHNIHGLFEHPVPWSLGPLGTDTPTPDGQSRVVLPESVMRDVLDREIAPLNSLAQMLFQTWPKARRLILAPPPPVGALGREIDLPRHFEDRASVRLAPRSLHRRLYELQNDLYGEYAKTCGAEIVGPLDHVKTKDGFLAPAFWGRDPTHGNLAYGRVMRDRLLETVREEP